MSIGHKIKKIREIKGYTQEYMADRLGLSTAGYGKIERDESELSVVRLEQIAKLFELKVEDITSFDEKMVFNNFGTPGNFFGYHSNGNYYGLGENERKLYEDKIKLLEDKIAYQAEQIEQLKKGK